MKKNLEVRLDNTLAGQTVIKSSDGFKIRRKRGVSGDRLKTDSVFEETRNAMSDFGVSAKAGKVLRASMLEALAHLADNTLYKRMQQAMSGVLRSSTTNVQGSRVITDGNLELLTGFEFNSKSPLKSSLLAPFTASIDIVTGEAKVHIPSFAPKVLVYGSKGATHFVLHMAAAAVNFANGTSVNGVAKSAGIPLTADASGDVTLTVALPPNSDLPLFLGFGIYFTKEENGIESIRKNGAYNAFALVKVSEE